MSETLQIRPADLLVDEENPRLAEPNPGQNKAYQALAKRLDGKLLAHAEDIVAFGIDPSSLPIVERVENPPGSFRVLEGNRRLTALKALENPDLVAGAVRPAVLKRLRQLSKDYQKNPVEQVMCVVMSREDSRHWITLRHTGENGGAGLVG